MNRLGEFWGSPALLTHAHQYKTSQRAETHTQQASASIVCTHGIIRRAFDRAQFANKSSSGESGHSKNR